MIMRKTLLAATAFTLASFAAPALAQDAAPAEAPAAAEPFTVTGSAALTTDYRFRGISQSNEKLAVQGGATLTHESGFYGSFWASSIDDYVAAGADAELDLIAGYSKTFNGVTLDGGLLYYVYASAADTAKTDFFEPYVSAKYTYGPVTGKVGAAYAFKQHAISASAWTGNSRDDNLYVYGELTGAIPETPISLTGHVGYSHGRSLLTFGQKDYLDWNLTAAYTWKNVTVGVTYVDTDVKKRSPYFAGYYDQVDASVLGSVTIAF
jgi:uncharacterized protein (TIGR02001 family)